MGAPDGEGPVCAGCGAVDGRACGCVDHSSLLSFLSDFSRAALEPAPDPTRPVRRAAARVGAEPAADQATAAGGEYPDGQPLPVWPPPPLPGAGPSEDVPPVDAVDVRDHPGDGRRRRLLRRPRA